MINKQIEKYKIIRLIGEGGMAKVYEAIHIRLGSRVAIKVLNEELVRKTNIRQRFENEARIMAELQHPNIVNIIDYVENDLFLAIVMELLQGVTLTDYIKAKGRLTKPEIIKIFRQVLSAFNLAHQKGIIHRDIKPSNIFLETYKDNNVKILDFGIAKLISSDLSITNSGAQMGSPLYMSPEQVKDSSTLDTLSDIYSLGVVLYHMVTGKPPYNDSALSRFDIFNKIVYEPLPRVTEYSEFNHIIQKATQKDPSLRYATCQEFAHDLEQLNNFGSISNPGENLHNSLPGIQQAQPPVKKEPVKKTKQKKNIPEKTQPSPKKSKPAAKKTVPAKKKTTKKSQIRKKKKQKNNTLKYVLGVLALIGLGVAIYFILKPVPGTPPPPPPPKKIPFNVALGNKVRVSSVAETAKGNYVAVGIKQNNQPESWSKYINKDGSTKNWKINGFQGTYLSGVESNDKGELLVAGYYENGNNSYIVLGKFKDNNKIFLDDFKAGKKNVEIRSMAIDKDKVILAGSYKESGKRKEPYILKITGRGKDLQVADIQGSNSRDEINKVLTLRDGYVFAGEKASKAWIFKTDKDLNLQWEKTFDYAKKITDVFYDDKKLYVTGEINKGNDSDIFFVKLDSGDGSEITSKKIFSSNKMENKPRLCIANDKIIFAVSQSVNDNTSKLILNITDLSGNEKSNDEIQKDGLYLSPASLMPTKDGGVLLLINEEKNYTPVAGRAIKFYDFKLKEK